MKEFLDEVWLFTPNEVEYEFLFKQTNPKNTIITMGDKGAVLLQDGKKTVFSPYDTKKVINTTGAGDVFNAGLAYYLALGKSLEEAIKFAIKASAFKVKSKYVVDGLPCLKDINEFKV